ncbi:MAG: hypothetical protein LBH16_09105 [Treponema sp.]|jgi:O-glycosyl hydrolase|nr:hypothetical protein [Treponema sp.]
MKRILLQFFILTGIFSAVLSCATSSAVKTTKEGTVNINYSASRQQIDGFGGSNAWTGVPRDGDAADELVKLLYSRTQGIGLTILRNRIPFRERLENDDTPSHNDGFLVRKSDGSYDYATDDNGVKTFNLNWQSWDLSGTRNLIKRINDLGSDGPEKLTVMSTPWTTPNNRVTQWKEDVTGAGARYDGNINWNTPDVWGRLKRDKFEDYADLLADYAKNFASMMGAPLEILSIQNEPNYRVNYESAYWNGEDIRDFLIIIGRRFPQKGVIPGAGGLSIMAPEFENFNVNFNELIKPSLSNEQSEKVLTHIALHQYNGAYDSSARAGALEHAGIISSGKRYWQTEVSGSGPNLPPGEGIENALYYARMIHFDFTYAQINAFLYWWLWRNDSEKNFPGSLVQVDYDIVNTSKRLYTVGQYSRFIRPGWLRIDCDTAPLPGVYSSAYKNPGSGEIAVVIINDRPAAVSIHLVLHDAEFKELESWRTSDKEDLKPLGKQKVSANTADVILPSKSVSTFYGNVR